MNRISMFRKTRFDCSLWGFTLIEIMLVLAIIAVLAVIAIPNLLRARLNSNEAAARANMHALVVAIESYAAQEGAYPTSELDMTNTTPPYLSYSICDQRKVGHDFNCTFSNGYIVRAYPYNCGVSGSRNYTVTTGNIWSESDCQ